MGDIFTDPVEARRYVLSFGDKFFGKKITHIETRAGKIHLYDMTDEQAVSIANLMKKNIEQGGMKRQK